MPVTLKLLSHLLVLVLLLGALPAAARSAPSAGSQTTVRTGQFRSLGRTLKRSLRQGARRARTGLAHRATQLKRRVMKTRAGKLLRRSVTRARYAGTLVGGKITLAMDGLQQRLSPRLARKLSTLRNLSPLGVGAFAFHKLRQDKAFFSSYGIFSWAFTNIQTPVLIGLGMNPLAAGAIRLVTGVPLDIGVVLFREHRARKREHPDATFADTLRILRSDLSSFLDQRRDQRRQFMAQRKARCSPRAPVQVEAGHSLRGLATPLLNPRVAAP